jgi:hydroxymethylpyrimidine pyrophosphatase-like HAD family hydrolase
MSKTFVFDVDGTLCEERKTFEKFFAAPKQDVIDIANKLFDAGHRIIVYTGRSWAEYTITEHWLKEHNVKYHMLMCGKVYYDHWIDDRAINVKNVEDLEKK